MQELAREGFRAAYQRRVFIIGVTVLAGLVGAIVALLSPDLYRAETVLVVTSVELTEDEALGAVIPEALSPKVYEILATSNDVLGKTLRALREKQVFETEPPKLRPFSQMVRASTQVVDPTTRPMNYSPLLILNAEADSQELASAIVDTWADVLIETARTANATRVSGAVELLADVQARNRDHLNEALAAVYESKAEANPEIALLEMEERQTAMNQIESQLATIEADREGFERQLNAARKSLAETKPIIELRKAPEDTAVWLSHIEDEGEENPLAGKSMITEELNPVHTQLEMDESNAQQNLMQQEGRAERLKQELADLQQRQNAAKKRFADYSLVQEQWQTEANYLKQAYTSLSTLEAFMTAARELTAPGPDYGVNPMGLNRLSDEVYAIEAPGLISGKVKLALAVIAGFVFSTLYVLYRALGPTLLNRLMS